jgi:pimeloyl-ACP methyl ester carboxylesterase
MQAAISNKTNNEKIPNLLSKFRSATGAKLYFDAYDKALKLWPVPFETTYAQSRFGETHVIISGSKDAQPLILLPGFGFTSTMWYPNIASLSQHYHVYAMDTIVDMGMSLLQSPLNNRSQFTSWLLDVFHSLDIDRPVVVGHSYGAWLALQLAVSKSVALSKLVLLAPPATFFPLSKEFVLRQLLTILFPRPRMLASFTRFFFTKGYVPDEKTSLILDLFRVGMLTTRFSNIPRPDRYTLKELQNVKVPTLFLVGENDVFYSPVQAVKRAQKLIPRIEAGIIPNAGHGLTLEKARTVNERILKFLG